MPGIRDILGRVTSDQRITSAEWKKQLAPALEGAPKKASDDARAILDAYVDNFEVDPGVRNDMQIFLQDAGYPVPRMNPPGMTPEERVLWKDRAITGNISETDATFLRLSELVGGGTTVPIAVVDSGFDLSHPAFEGKLWVNEQETPGNGIDDDGNGFVDDVSGWDFDDNDADVTGGEHGTHVAGIASRATDLIKFLPIRGHGPVLTAQSITDSLEYACAQGARVVNMSYKIDDPDEVEAARAVMAKYPDVLFVKSAGNDGEQLGAGRFAPETFLPSNEFPNMLVVAAAGMNDKPARYSNYGAPFADLAMRGSAVYSSVPDNGYRPQDGTSMATPNVTNVAARCISLAPHLKPAQVASLLTACTVKSPDWDGLVASGGVVDEVKAQQVAAMATLLCGGTTVATAAEKLGLDPAAASELGALAQQFA